MIPMSNTRHDYAIEIGKHRFHGLAALWRRGGQRFFNLSRLIPRQNREALGMSEVIGYPIDNFVAVFAKIIRTHVAESCDVFCLHFRFAFAHWFSALWRPRRRIELAFF